MKTLQNGLLFSSNIINQDSKVHLKYFTVSLISHVLVLNLFSISNTHTIYLPHALLFALVWSAVYSFRDFPGSTASSSLFCHFYQQLRPCSFHLPLISVLNLSGSANRIFPFLIPSYGLSPPHTSVSPLMVPCAWTSISVEEQDISNFAHLKSHYLFLLYRDSATVWHLSSLHQLHSSPVLIIPALVLCSAALSLKILLLASVTKPKQSALVFLLTSSDVSQFPPSSPKIFKPILHLHLTKYLSMCDPNPLVLPEHGKTFSCLGGFWEL